MNKRIIFSHLLFILGVVFVLPEFSLALQVFKSEAGNQFILNDGGLPQIAIHPTDSSIGYVINYDSNNPYQRDVFIAQAKLKSVSEASKYEHIFQMLKGIKIFNKLKFFFKKTKVEGIELSVLPDELKKDPWFVENLENIRYGANKARNFTTVEEFISRNQITIDNFDREMNLKITDQYGAGFSSEVYAKLLTSIPANHRTSDEVFKIYNDQDFRLNDPANKTGFKLLVVKGLLQNVNITDPEHPFDKLIDELKSDGFDVEVVETRTMDEIRANVPLVAKKIDSMLTAGQNVILVSASKGVPEILGALAMLNKEGKLKSQPGRGKVLGSLLGSGVTGGSFLADFASKKLMFPLVNLMLKRIAKQKGVTVQNAFAAVNSLSSKYIKEFFEEIKPNIPQDMLFVNFLGVSHSRDGYATSSDVRFLQEKIISRSFFPKHGANDGLVELADLGLKTSIAPGSVTLVFDADHSIVTGEFRGISFGEKESRLNGMKSMLEFIIRSAEDSEKKSHPENVIDVNGIIKNLIATHKLQSSLCIKYY